MDVTNDLRTYSNFSIPDIPTFRAEILHSGQCKLAEITILNSRGNKGHRNVT